MIITAFVLALVAPLACATIVVQAPTDMRSDTPITLTWSSSDPTDPPIFSFELQNEIFHNTYAIANNVPTSQGTLVVTIPSVPPGDGYSLQAVNVSNLNDVYSQTGQFSVGAALSSSTSSTATATGSKTGVVGVTTSTKATGTSTGFGSTVSVSTTSSTTGATSGTQTSSTSTASATPFNNGAKRSSGSSAALAMSILAGVAFLAL